MLWPVSRSIYRDPYDPLGAKANTLNTLGAIVYCDVLVGSLIVETDVSCVPVILLATI